MSKTLSTPKTECGASKTKPTKVAGPSKLDTLVKLLRQLNGATIHELAAATKWETHSVRGALAGALKKKGHSIASEVAYGVRRYRIVEAQA